MGALDTLWSSSAKEEQKEIWLLPADELVYTWFMQLHSQLLGICHLQENLRGRKVYAQKTEIWASVQNVTMDP